jgi:glyoxylase-like metal-dependent hydrolase (beta-lactamase superfamily II)
MAPTAEDSLLQVRSWGVCFYALHDQHEEALYLIDGGFIGGIAALDHALAAKGWAHLPVRGILVTHGHLDHILNIAALARRHRAWVAAPRLDRDYYAGQARHRGLSRFTGALEWLGQRAFTYQAFTPDRLLDPGEHLDLWHGLRAEPLPGHTFGHTGYFCASLGLLFSADLFASYGALSHRPPRLFNADTAQAHASLRHACSLPLRGVLPCHADHADAATHLARMQRLGTAHESS